MVPHSWRQGIQQPTNMLRNRSTLLKLEKKIFITINMTIMCTSCRQGRCGKYGPPSAPSETVPSAVLSTSAGKLVINRPFEKRGMLFVWSATPPSQRILPPQKASISGSIAKHPLMRLSTLAFRERIKFDNADAGRMPACVLALRGGRGGGCREGEGGS
jgi:hypothetical protein